MISRRSISRCEETLSSVVGRPKLVSSLGIAACLITRMGSQCCLSLTSAVPNLASWLGTSVVEVLHTDIQAQAQAEVTGNQRRSFG